MRAMIAVVGPGDAAGGDLAAAYAVGRAIATRGATLVCGGLGGVMAAACRGARDGGGLAVGLLPGLDRADGNPYLDVAIATGLGQGRNLLVVRTSDALVAVGGSWGTLSEISLACREGRRVVALGGWHVTDAAGTPVPGVLRADTPAHAVDLALSGDRPPGG